MGIPYKFPYKESPYSAVAAVWEIIAYLLLK
jgi:hypothetical protein